MLCRDKNGGDHDDHNRKGSAGTKYLVFAPTNAGLGNHMAGMMSAFVLSVAFERVFLHEWNVGTSQ